MTLRNSTTIARSATTAHDNPPLHALANGTDGGNGVFVYSGTPAFPNQTYQASTYWVDVVFHGSGASGLDAYGIPDAWKTQYFGSPAAAGSGALDDPDHDGRDNLSEYIAGTVPTNGLSVLRILALEPVTNGMRVRFQGNSGRRYRLGCLSDLASTNWIDLTNNLPGTGAEAQVTDTDQAPARFYRLGVRLE